VALTEEQIRARHILLRVRPEEPTPTPVPEGQPTPEPTATATALPEGAPTPTPTPGPRDDAATLALANELRTRLLAGEDFAALAEEYSDDGSSASGGDLGWFARGAMVAPFEEAAFALAVDEISEPVKTDFGYHLIQVLERDAERPKDEATLAQERSTTFQTWLEGQLASTTVERGNIFNALPRGF
jgi:parvulin-like peptidyl-prolyl isomerase